MVFISVLKLKKKYIEIYIYAILGRVKIIKKHKLFKKQKFSASSLLWKEACQWNAVCTTMILKEKHVKFRDVNWDIKHWQQVLLQKKSLCA